MATDVTHFYDPNQKRVVLIPMRSIDELRPRIVKMSMGRNSTTLKMAPKWFKYDNYDDALKDVVYPQGIYETHRFDTIARYRSSINQPNNDFRQMSIDLNENNTEIVVVALDDFIRPFGGELAFTKQKLTFEETTHRTACGIANLSSAHLLATGYVQTAQFDFIVNLDYQKDLARSTDTMKNFLLDFSDGIAEVLTCPKDYVRVSSVEKRVKNPRQSTVIFGITTPNRRKTEEFVQHLKDSARKPFTKHRVLKYIQPREYHCKWMPLINFFQLKPSDFDTKHNIYYRQGMNTQDKRGGLPYYLPIGWYRHALKVTDKYPDDQLWLGHDNVKGEWAVAFHGTHGGAVKGITEKGLLITEIDLMKEEAIQQGGADFDKAGLYVATHCNGGAHPQYTEPFVIEVGPNQSETYRVVFQCRVKPGAFTFHHSPVSVGQAWRFVDPEAIRPYGILIKKEE